MKSAGIIAEYNPFHNGHLYQIETLKQDYGFETVTIIMSGEFVQRGAPAWTDKYLRTRMALDAGADFVFELPSRFALSSAEAFAMSGVSLLAASGLADTLCFGCECEQPDILQQTAAFLYEAETARDSCPDHAETELFRQYHARIQSAMKKGMTYPLARQNALKALLPALNGYNDTLLSSPNNILAIEYLKANRKQKTPLSILPLLRTDGGYHSQHITGSLASASAIRQQFCRTGSLRGLERVLPAFVWRLLQEEKRFPIETDDFSDMMYYRLRQITSSDHLTDYPDISEELSQRIRKLLPEYQTVSQFTGLVKTKNYTYSRISRSLFHILLDQKKEESSPAAPYLRLLGMKKDKSYLLRQVSKIPVITKVADASGILGASSDAWNCFQQDILAADIYRQAANHKLGCHIPDEYRAGTILV